MLIAIENYSMNINEIRKLNLRRLIERSSPSGKVADFAKTYDIDASYLSQLLNKHRTMGEKSARNIEIKVGLSAGDLDKPVSGAVAEKEAMYLATQEGPAALELMRQYLAASPEMKAAALRLLGVSEDLHNSTQPKKPIQ